jgi:hypothetical protein
VDGNVFRSSAVARIAKSVLALVAVNYLPSVGVRKYDELGRIDRPAVMERYDGGGLLALLTERKRR